GRLCSRLDLLSRSIARARSDVCHTVGVIRRGRRGLPAPRPAHRAVAISHPYTRPFEACAGSAQHDMNSLCVRGLDVPATLLALANKLIEEQSAGGLSSGVLTSTAGPRVLPG